MELFNENKIYENSDSLLCLVTVYFTAATRKITNIRNLILAKLSPFKGPKNECKCPKNESQRENTVHRICKSTSTINFVQHISPIKPSLRKEVGNFPESTKGQVSKF